MPAPASMLPFVNLWVNERLVTSPRQRMGITGREVLRWMNKRRNETSAGRIHMNRNIETTHFIEIIKRTGERPPARTAA